jgi:hypothetical protein
MVPAETGLLGEGHGQVWEDAWQDDAISAQERRRITH